MEEGKLYICPTPIGNLEDITLRTLRVLKEVDLIAAEDTRHSIKLLNHFEIKTPLTSYHEHNEREKGSVLIKKIMEGSNIGLVSDAGMPGISDPGQEIIKMAIEEGIEVIVLPGATASITALVASGLDTGKFVFEGFLSSKKRDRIQELESLKEERRTLIFYESPHRILDSLEDMIKILGNRQISLAREISKVYEEFFRGSLEEVRDMISKKQVRGEFVLILEGNKDEEEVREIDIRAELEKYLEEGYSKKASVKIVAEKYGLAKNQVYQESLKID